MKKVTVDIEGPQHPQITQRMSELYKELFESIPFNLDKKELSRFFPMKGNNYGSALPKIMIVGRSPNGWTEINEETSEDFVLAAGNEMLSDKGFYWIDKDNKTSKYINEKNELKTYNINRSAFWRLIKLLVEKVAPLENQYKQLDPKATEQYRKELKDMFMQRWFEQIVWTNLYPIAPKYSGNATEKIKTVQTDICAELLLEQIKFFKPTYIIFITDWDYWFGNFENFFPNVKKIGSSDKDNIVGYGDINGIKTVVTVRPDRRKNKPNEEKMAKDIFDAM